MLFITFSQISVRNRAEVSASRELAVSLSADALNFVKDDL